jgi:hypothetical protein
VRRLACSAVVLASVGTALCSSLPPPSLPPQEVAWLEVWPLLRHVSDYATSLGISSEFPPVVGEKPIETPVIPVRELKFAPGSRLVFRGEAFAKANEVVILAKRITVQGQERAVITWSRGPTPLPSPPPRGTAVPGAAGTGEGLAGTPGADGEDGNPGYRGADAPTVYIVVGSVEGPGIDIDVRGGEGGIGGKGQNGGTGGNGTPGVRGQSVAIRIPSAPHGFPPTMGTSDVFTTCARPPGPGGSGGGGGKAGNGGIGGVGGRGGSVLLVVLDRSASTFFRVLADGGKGGSGGPPGEPGAKGKPGPPGMGAVGCPEASSQQTAVEVGGAGTAVDRPGAGGPDGTPGQYVFTKVPRETFDRIFSPKQ